MSSALEPTALSSEELADLQVRLADEAARRYAIGSATADFFVHLERVRRMALDFPVIPFMPVPVWGDLVGHPPGQHVLFEGVTFVNVGDCYLSVEPLETVDWAVVEPAGEAS